MTTGSDFRVAVARAAGLIGTGVVCRYCGEAGVLAVRTSSEGEYLAVAHRPRPWFTAWHRQDGHGPWIEALMGADRPITEVLAEHGLAAPRSTRVTLGSSS